MYNKNDYKGCVVIQGQTLPDILPKLKEKWSGYQIIFSTWMGSEEHYQPDDVVIFSQMPEVVGKSNLNLQKITTWNGLTLAKKMGWDRALKWRSDMYPNDADSLWRTFNMESLNFFAWHDSEGGYVTDYFMEGDVLDILGLFDIEDVSSHFPERHVTRRMYELGLDKKAGCIGNKLHSNTDVLWVKNGIWLSSYREVSSYRYEIPKR
jgi:hypothetical protein